MNLNKLIDAASIPQDDDGTAIAAGLVIGKTRHLLNLLSEARTLLDEACETYFVGDMLTEAKETIGRIDDVLHNADGADDE